MNDYKHPLTDVEFVLNELVQFDQLCETAGLEEVNAELASVILTEAGKLGTGMLAPLNRTGDEIHPVIVDNAVKETKGFAEAYQAYVEGGWATLTAAEEFGGQNLPNVLGTAVNEVWQTCNLSFALCPLLSQGAIESISHHGSDALKEHYLPKLVSGEWTGTMNLTEAGAGTDLAAVSTKAVPNGDHYLITGQKIFITWGDHQMTENILHLVLARLPGAPAGVKGISLFIVPKFLLDENGNPAERNDAYAVSLEHKMGIHGSPTCVMSFGDNGGAVGYLVGEEHNGLAYMFTMMNHARQGVGLQGLGVSEAAYQLAVQFAKDRIQGTKKDGSRYPIIRFADVRRMLMQMKSGTEAMRALCLVAAAEADRENTARQELLTPIVKGWVTEFAQELTSLGIQIHGGMGFIEETGAAQYYRDARILPIYEGTTGVQALDLVGRKTLMNGGESLQALLDEMAADISAFEAIGGDFILAAQQCRTSLDNGIAARQWLLDTKADRNASASACVNFMMLFGFLCGGWLMAKSALQAQAKLAVGEGDPKFLQAKLISARFYCEHMMPRTQSYLAAVIAGSESVMALDEEQF